MPFAMLTSMNKTHLLYKHTSAFNVMLENFAAKQIQQQATVFDVEIKFTTVIKPIGATLNFERRLAVYRLRWMCSEMRGWKVSTGPASVRSMKSTGQQGIRDGSMLGSEK
ncbi:hypothetical protein CHS0354_010333 [Potamilus streckersoni]|uniref:Uncharacterized protein n=1 Tax=Potamilus streckersoni TaxID=2493646 RepID=A0AAE0TDY9_9BIVA|nr:hypothetical protein CHS0354_010333 [Potamilus streckersoni]